MSSSMSEGKSSEESMTCLKLSRSVGVASRMETATGVDDEVELIWKEGKEEVRVEGETIVGMLKLDAGRDSKMVVAIVVERSSCLASMFCFVRRVCWISSRKICIGVLMARYRNVHQEVGASTSRACLEIPLGIGIDKNKLLLAVH